MSEFSGHLWDNAAGYVQSWLLPSALGVGFFSFVLLPVLEDESPWSDLVHAGATTRVLAFSFATFVVSFLLASTSRPLLRFLEGYTLWPPSLRRLLVESHRRRRQELLDQVTSASSLEDKLALRERLDGYPRRSVWVLPTRLGNALRAGETYGWSQYRLSTVDLWTRLTAVADENVNQQLVQSRAVLDFFVALIVLSLSLAPATIAVAFWGGNSALLLWLVVLVGLLPLWYQRAVAAVTWHAQCMQALVDLGRVPLAQKLGLQLPGSIAEERRLWRAVSDYTAWGPGWSASPGWQKRIDDALMPRGAPRPDEGGPEAH